VLDRGRILQRGTASELAASPASAFVADFTGAVVLTGVAERGPGGVTRIALEGGGTVTALDPAQGPVAVSIYPWEVALEPPGAAPVGSAQNRLAAEVVSLTTVGNRVRVGLTTPQPLVSEVTEAAAGALGLRPGGRVTATWKAAATRVVPL
jgi:molybdate transport system ATP-binding protein